MKVAAMAKRWRPFECDFCGQQVMEKASASYGGIMDGDREWKFRGHFWCVRKFADAHVGLNDAPTER